MEGKTANVVLTAEHVDKLLNGGQLKIRVQPDTEFVMVSAQMQWKTADRNYFAEIIDVFFNGRKAR